MSLCLENLYTTDQIRKLEQKSTTRMKILTLAALVTISLVNEVEDVVVPNRKSQELGLKMAVRALESVCWYEHQKLLPKANASKFETTCSGNGLLFRDQILGNLYFTNHPEEMTVTFGKWIKTTKNSFNLSADYWNNCSKFLKDEEVIAQIRNFETYALNERNATEGYPLRTFAHCIIHVLRRRFGEKAITAVEKEITGSGRNWRTSIFDRENEFRKLHGVKPFTLDNQLSENAQRHADSLAKQCKLIPSNHLSRTYNGHSNVGENLLGVSFSKDDDISAAYDAANKWYEGSKYYPFNRTYYDEIELLNLINKFGRFSQVVWKSTTLVGYGYAFNETCKKTGGLTTFVVARYFPQGNIFGAGRFKENVFPINAKATKKRTKTLRSKN